MNLVERDGFQIALNTSSRRKQYREEFYHYYTQPNEAMPGSLQQMLANGQVDVTRIFDTSPTPILAWLVRLSL